MASVNNFKVKHGLVVATTATILSADQATSTTTGALQVVGGVGIGRNLYVGGTTFLAGDLYVDGTQFSVSSSTIATGDKAIYLSTGSTTAISATDSGIAIGPQTSTYASFLFDGVESFKSAASIVPATSSTYNLGSPELTWGTIYTDSFSIKGTTASTSTETGAITISGGVGIGGDLNLGGNLVVHNSAIVHDQTAITVSTSIVTLDTFDLTKYRSAKYVISVSNSGLGQFQTSEVLLIHNDTDSFINHTSISSADSPLMSFTTLVSGVNVLLKGIGSSNSNKVKIQKIYITV